MTLADLVRWRRTRFTPTARSPSRVAVLILLDESSEEVAPTSSENKHWTLLLENRWATGLLQELLCTVKCTVDRNSWYWYMSYKNKSSNNNQWVAWNKGEKWIDFSVFNIVIFDFDKLWYGSLNLNFPCKKIYSIFGRTVILTPRWVCL